MKPPRTPWPKDFPDLIVQADYRVMRQHPDYRDAKDGISDEAALRLVEDLLKEESLAQLRRITDALNAIVVGVHAIEQTGRNKIPLAYAELLANRLDLIVDEEIVQTSIANHGGAPSIYHRLVAQPTFGGSVERGASYVIVDDNVTAGGTLANLKGHIETSGGHVVAMSSLSRSTGANMEISLALPTLARLRYKHRQLAGWWQQEFGHGLECLTEGEAGHLLAAPSARAIRDRIAEARQEIDFGANETPDHDR